MNADNALEAIEQLLPSRQLSPIEQLIVRQSWVGKSYDEMAQDSNYSGKYFRDIGSNLWDRISSVIGQKVTKKNIYLVIPQYLKNKQVFSDTEGLQPNYLSSSINNFFPNLVTSQIIANNRIDSPSIPLSAGSLFYINRPPCEELACMEINNPGCVVRIRGARKMGKSSLLNLVTRSATTYGYETAYLDFLEADEAIFSNLDKFLRWFCANVSRQLHLEYCLNDYWDEDIGSKVSCKLYFQEYLLKQIKTPLVLVLNEVNRVFEHPNIAIDFLPMLRFWHEMGRSVEVWQKLRLVIAHSTEIYIPLKLHQSPFNVGLAIKLPFFTNEQVRNLAIRYQLESISDSQIHDLVAMVGGHPYLVSLAFYHISQGNITFQELLRTVPTLGSIYSDYLRGHLATLLQQPELADSLRKILSSDKDVFLDAITVYKLESMGLIHLDGNHAFISCQLYRLYFSHQLGC